MKIRSLILAVIILPSIALSNDDIYDAALVFERGLSVGVDAVEREYRVQGWKKEEVSVLDFMVVLDSKSCSTKRLLLLKDFGFRRGLAPVELSNGMLLYKSFDNRPDAEELVKYLNGAELKEIKEKVYVYKKRSDEKLTKAPFAFKYIFDQMQKEIKGDVQVVVLSPEQAKKFGVIKDVPAPISQPLPVIRVETLPAKEAPMPSVIVKEEKQKELTKVVDVNTSKQIIKQKPIAAKKQEMKPLEKKTIIKAPRVSQEIVPTKSFRLKSGSAEFFSYNSAWAGKDDVFEKSFEDQKFKPKSVIKNKGQIFQSSGVVTSNSGVKYVKIVGKNMYFDAYDTSIGGE